MPTTGTCEVKWEKLELDHDGELATYPLDNENSCQMTASHSLIQKIMVIGIVLIVVCMVVIIGLPWNIKETTEFDLIH